MLEWNLITTELKRTLTFRNLWPKETEMILFTMCIFLENGDQGDP